MVIPARIMAPPDRAMIALTMTVVAGCDPSGATGIRKTCAGKSLTDTGAGSFCLSDSDVELR